MKSGSDALQASAVGEEWRGMSARRAADRSIGRLFRASVYLCKGWKAQVMAPEAAGSDAKRSRVVVVVGLRLRKRRRRIEGQTTTKVQPKKSVVGRRHASHRPGKIARVRPTPTPRPIHPKGPKRAPSRRPAPLRGQDASPKIKCGAPTCGQECEASPQAKSKSKKEEFGVWSSSRRTLVFQTDCVSHIHLPLGLGFELRFNSRGYWATLRISQQGPGHH